MRRIQASGGGVLSHPSSSPTRTNPGGWQLWQFQHEDGCHSTMAPQVSICNVPGGGRWWDPHPDGTAHGQQQHTLGRQEGGHTTRGGGAQEEEFRQTSVEVTPDAPEEAGCPKHQGGGGGVDPP